MRKFKHRHLFAVTIYLKLVKLVRAEASASRLVLTCCCRLYRKRILWTARSPSLSP